ncbi:hypothetical protein CDL15_Pgr003614 [Punica granatum]|uniref:Uncharacterized protein n=1 Tax=Punica granatum TaxID=22663 RepID=A0A218XVA1_PUNGR|nr:hypothetical protein CDL15_Pgr003614 [Punica granatum]
MPRGSKRICFAPRLMSLLRWRKRPRDGTIRQRRNLLVRIFLSRVGPTCLSVRDDFDYHSSRNLISDMSSPVRLRALLSSPLPDDSLFRTD